MGRGGGGLDRHRAGELPAGPGRLRRAHRGRRDLTSTGDDIAAVLGTRIEGGDPPDVAILPQPGLMADLAEQGALQPIEEVAGDEVDANYAPVWRELGSVDGTLYGVWFKAANKSTVWYNVGVFRDAGVQPPATWDDFLGVARTIADFGVPPVSIGGADGWTLTDWFENVYIRSAGADAYDRLTRHEIPWTDQSVKDALGIMAQLMGDESLIAGGTRGALQTDFPTSVTQVFTDPPGAAIVYEGDFVAGVITGETDAQLGTDADFFDFPAIDGSPPAVVGGGDVAVLLTDSEAGKALIEFLATPEAGEIWAGLGGFTSPNQNVDLAVYPDDITRKSAEALTSAEVFRFDLSDLQPAEFGATVGQGLFKLFQDFLANPDDIDGVTEAMEAAAAQAFG
ncbi:MAG TPA: extracellular solute-binding protein [Actinomycetota bacterium]|nr:extracellular solute-binding protein [Actinomycetota bacterium]